MTTQSGSPPGEVFLEAGEVARLAGGRVEGDASKRVRGIAPLENASSEQIGFLATRSYLRFLPETRAGVLLLSMELADEVSAVPEAPTTRIVVDDPHRALPALLSRFHSAPAPKPGIHPTAVLGEGVEIGESVRIGPYAVVEEGAVLGPRVRIGAHSVVGRGCRIGADSVLHPHVVLYPGSELGQRVVLHAGVRIGVDGFGYVTEEDVHRKIPQVGRCLVDDDVEVGANSALDRGSIGNTRIGRGVKIDNLVHLGHNVEVGDGSMLVAQVGISGSTRLGARVLCGGQVGMAGHIEVGDGARIGGQAGVIGDVEAGETVSGYPARDHREYLKGMAMVLKLPELRRRIRALEDRLGSQKS